MSESKNRPIPKTPDKSIVPKQLSKNLVSKLKKSAKDGVELRQRILPINKEALNKRGYSLTGRDLKKYDFVRKNFNKEVGFKELDLRDRDAKAVELEMINNMVDGVKLGHARAAKLRNAKPEYIDDTSASDNAENTDDNENIESVAESKSRVNVLKARTLKVNMSETLCKKIGLGDGKTKTIKMVELKNILRISQRVVAQDRPLKSAVQKRSLLKENKEGDK